MVIGGLAGSSCQNFNPVRRSEEPEKIRAMILKRNDHACFDRSAIMSAKTADNSGNCTACLSVPAAKVKNETLDPSSREYPNFRSR